MNTRKRSHRYPLPDEYQQSYYDSKIGLLDCGYQKLRSLEGYPFEEIRVLMVDFNALTQLPALPKLEYLYCRKNRLSDLPYYPQLKYLSAPQNQIRRLDPRYANNKLEWVDLSANEFVLDVSLPHCTDLYLAENNLKTFDFSLVPAIKILDLSYNALSSLADHSRIRELHVQGNLLVSLGKYDNLAHLNASENLISRMELLPCLDTLNISHNSLKRIHQPSLTSLIACHNHLESFQSPPNLAHLDISHNKIRTISISRRVVSAFVHDNVIVDIRGDYHDLKEITMDYATYRLIYPRLKANIRQFSDTVLPDKLSMIDLTTKKAQQAYLALEKCRLGKHENVLANASKLLNVPYDKVKEWYYGALRITLHL